MQTPLGRDLLGNARQLDGNTLEKRFLLPPFSYLDSTSDAWQARRAAWARLVPFGFSVDPVLVELLYHWFCPLGGVAISNSIPAQEVLERIGDKEPETPARTDFVDFALIFQNNKRPWLTDEYEEFLYLQANRFAAVVLPAEWARGRLVYETEEFLQGYAAARGLHYLNEIILGHEVQGNLAPWIPAQTQSKILVFCKGDPRQAASVCNRGCDV